MVRGMRRGAWRAGDDHSGRHDHGDLAGSLAGNDFADGADRTMTVRAVTVAATQVSQLTI